MILALPLYTFRLFFCFSVCSFSSLILNSITPIVLLPYRLTPVPLVTLDSSFHSWWKFFKWHVPAYLCRLINRQTQTRLYRISIQYFFCQTGLDYKTVEWFQSVRSKQTIVIPKLHWFTFKDLRGFWKDCKEKSTPMTFKITHQFKVLLQLKLVKKNE